MRALVWIAISLAACGCGGSTRVEGAGGSGGSTQEPSAGGSGGSTQEPSAGGGAGGAAVTDACAEYVPQATAREISTTPRANAAAEVLAVEASGELVAPDLLYERVVAELPAIAALQPLVAGMMPFSPVMAPAIIVGFDERASQNFQADGYHDWDCANRAYGVDRIESLLSGSFAALSFGNKRYNVSVLEREYGALPGVTGVDPNLGGDGPDICLEVQGDQHFYVFDKADGDCPAGCIEHHYFGFQVAPGAVVTELGTFDRKPAAPEPAWFGALSHCREWL